MMFKLFKADDAVGNSSSSNSMKFNDDDDSNYCSNVGDG